MRVLLVEPNYKNKYPPMGLMKISTYHKMLGDEVHFVKGYDPALDQEVWDRIYVTTLFTFDFAISVETINHYLGLVDNINSLFVGGIMASLMPDRIVEATGIDRSHILTGLFTDTSVVGDDNNINIDQLPLDYDILEEISYRYPAGDNYFAYTTRGCPNHCPFCAVPTLEPVFCITNNIIDQITTINKRYGPKQNLLLLDNNVLNVPDLKALVDDLCEAGFQRGAKYCNAVRTAFRHGIKEISNYILFNYMDKPEDLYERLRINIELNEEMGIKIFSFPMRFSPIDRTDRDYIGVNWKYRKYLRAISAILHVTKGVVAAGTSFFEAAFGKNQEEYFEILAMPREMIIHRNYYKNNGTTERWRELYRALTEDQKDRLMQIVSHTVGELRSSPCPDEFKEILPFYLLKYNGEISSIEETGKQMSLLEDGDVFDEEL